MRRIHLNISISDDVLTEVKRLGQTNISGFIDSTLRKALCVEKPPEETVRTCAECDNEKDINNFIQHKGRGIISKSIYCKSCRLKRRRFMGGDHLKGLIRNASRKNYWKDHEKSRARSNKYYSKNKDKILEKQANASPFIKKVKNTRSRRKWWENRDRELNRGRSYYAANKEKVNLRIKEYRRLNPDVPRNYWHKRRAKIIGLSINITRESIAGRIEIYGHLCAYCGKPYEQLDHVKSVALMGMHCPANIRPACKSCNLKKGKMKWIDWVKRCKHITGLPVSSLPGWF
jgi:5-methylcytosine-specific restriction endonuclease McrA